MKGASLFCSDFLHQSVDPISAAQTHIGSMIVKKIIIQKKKGHKPGNSTNNENLFTEN